MYIWLSLLSHDFAPPHRLCLTRIVSLLYTIVCGPFHLGWLDETADRNVRYSAQGEEPAFKMSRFLTAS